jgi:beta-glucosidase
MVTATVEVTNTGDRPGRETVELYVSDLVASVTPPVKVLRGFQKVQLKPKETQTLRFTLTPADLSFIGRDDKLVLEPGEFRVQVGEIPSASPF